MNQNAFLDFLCQWNPLIQAFTLIALIIYVWKTWSMASATSKAARASEKSLCEMKLSREEHAKPKVVCYFEHNSTSRRTYDLVIKNYGNSAAFNVSLVFSPPLERYGQTKILPVEEKTFKIMAPGYEWRTFWDSFPDSDGLSMPDEFLANVSYEGDNPRKPEKSEVSFDIKSQMGMKWIGGPTVEESLKNSLETSHPKRMRRYREKLPLVSKT